MPLSVTLGKSRATRAPLALANTTDNILNQIGPVRVFRFGMHITVAKTTGTAGVFTLQSVAGVTETSLGTATMPDTAAVNTTLYKEFNPPLVVAIGAHFKIEQTTAANDGSAVLFIEYADEFLIKIFFDGVVVLT